MHRADFSKVVEEVLDSLPGEFRRRIRNVAVLVEDLPSGPAAVQAGAAHEIDSGYLPWRGPDNKEECHQPAYRA